MPPRNIVTDDGAVGDGVTDDGPAFTRFNTWAKAQTGLVDLTIPFGAAGTYQVNLVDSAAWCFKDIPQLRVTGIGNPTIRGNFFLGSFTFPNTNQASARIATANAGQSTLTLLSGGDAAKLNPANTITLSNGIVYTPSPNVVVTAFDTQQEFGSPPNPYFFEFATSTGVVGTTVSVATPLQYSYSAAFPLYYAGDPATAIDEGGPATIYILDKSWNCNLEYIGLTFDRGSTQIYANGRTVKFTSCGCPSIFGIVPSVNETFTYDGGDYSACGVEVDKMIDALVAQNGAAFSSLIFQSAGTNRLTGSSSTGFLNGTPKDTSLVGWTGAVQIGVSSYGRTNSFSSTSGSHSAVTASGSTDTDVTASIRRHTGASGAYAINNGIIAVPTNCAPVRWAIPGTKMILQGSSEAEGTFAVTGSPTDDGNTTRIPTNIPGISWPTVALQNGTRLDVMAHPCPLLTMVNCAGSNDAINLSQPGARGKPIYSYSKWAYSKSDTTGTPYGPRVWGRAGSVRIRVSSPYAGAGALLFYPFGQFGGQSINLKIAGMRILTANSVGGSQSGDALSALGTAWCFPGPFVPFFDADVSAGANDFSVEVEFDADQGQLGPPAGKRQKHFAMHT